MDRRKMAEQIAALIARYGHEILGSPGMQAEKRFLQHGNASCYDHSIRVAHVSLWLVLRARLSVNLSSLVRGALLHDYFLYDWHIPDPSHRWHGFTHARTALRNATRDFHLNEIERDIIAKHMFPLTLGLAKYKESAIVCLADKLCAVWEAQSLQRMKHVLAEIRSMP